jgi:hypothetical protein
MPVHLNLSTFEDLAAFKSAGLLAGIFNDMHNILQSGDHIVIERRYSNAAPDAERIIRTEEELAEFEDHWLSMLE